MQDLGIRSEIPLKMPIIFFFRHSHFSGRCFLKDVLSIPSNHSENIGLHIFLRQSLIEDVCAKNIQEAVISFSNFISLIFFNVGFSCSVQNRKGHKILT